MYSYQINIINSINNSINNIQDIILGDRLYFLSIYFFNIFTENQIPIKSPTIITPIVHKIYIDVSTS